MLVTMVTTIDRESGSVLYTVCTGDPLLGDHGDSREVWRKEVPFGFRDRFRAGGAAFVEAAREQAQVAESYEQMPYEPTGKAVFIAREAMSGERQDDNGNTQYDVVNRSKR